MKSYPIPTTLDLLIRAGRIVDPQTGRDGPGIIGVRGGRICRIEIESADGFDCPRASRTIDVNDGIVLPGLIDLHAHPAVDSVFGVEPDRHMLGRGVTTVQSQGDAGSSGIEAWSRNTIECSETRVLLAINLSRIGEATAKGCFENLDDADVAACVTAVERHRELINMISVNVSHHACGATDPREVLRRGLEAAERTGLCILFGMRRPEDWPLPEQLRLLRPGDVITYCFRREPHCIVENSRLLPCAREARKRGVLFDVGHGRASFSFDVAEAAIADGFPPDTISTDLQRGHMGSSPTHDLPLVMSKLQAAGMTDSDVFRSVTATPASTLGVDSECGSLTPGTTADLTVLSSDTKCQLVDAHGETRQGTLWSPRMIVRSGRLVSFDSPNVS